VCGNRILHHVAPDTAEQRDRAHVEAAERTAWQARAFTITPDGHGRYRLRGSTTAEGAAMLHAILDPLTHPRRHQASPTAAADTADTTAADTIAADTAAAEPAADTTAADTAAAAGPAGTAGTAGTADSAAVPPAFRDPRNAAQRRHDALLDALRLLLATDTLPDNGGNKPQIMVTVGYDLLRQELDGGLLDTGAPLPAAEVRKMACDAGIVPAILDSHSVPLDLGRERRLISGALRKALILRDRGCTWPGCDRGPRWCQAHHPKPWHTGGNTCLTNAVLACGFHHRLLHHDHS
jgi:hypothetical protein